MNARELINHITKRPERIRLLRGLRETPATPSELQERYSIARSSVYDTVGPLEAWGGVDAADTTRTLTGTGVIAVRECARTCITLDREELATLSSTENRITVLRGLREPAVQLAELSRRLQLSRSTVRRAIEIFTEYGWVQTNGEYTLTATGEQTVAEYDRLEGKLQQVNANGAFLRRLGSTAEDFPTEALDGVRMVADSADYYGAVARECRRLATDDFQRLRVVNHSFSPELARAYNRHIRDDTEIQTVIDPGVYDKITRLRNIPYIAGGVWRRNYELYLFPDDLSIGLGIYDNERVMVTAHTETRPREAAIIGENDALVEWAVEFYEQCRQNSTQPNHLKEIVVRGARRALP